MAGRRVISRLVVLACAALLGAVPADSGGTAPPARRLIEMGWDEPDTKFMRQHVREMEQSPFDGVVFHVNVSRTNGPPDSHAWVTWGHRVFAAAEFDSAIADLKATKFKRLHHNFIRMNVSPGLDWFDDFSSVVANARLLAHVARVGGADGIMFDTEPYNQPVWDYSHQKDAATRSFDEYAAQARARGREVMRAIASEFPDAVVFYTFCYSHVWWQCRYGAKPLSTALYGLMPAFLDGMLEGADPRNRFVDGHELAFGYRDAGNFKDARKQMKSDVLAIVGPDSLYRRSYSASFGLWLDIEWRRRGWSGRDTTGNYYSPAVFEAMMRAAMAESDDYVWVYTEKPRWWTGKGGPSDLPRAYQDAVTRGRH
jgi:hypothetical protein